MMTDRHPMLRAAFSLRTRSIRRLVPNATLLIGGGNRYDVRHVVRRGNSSTYSFRHVCFDHNSSGSVCRRHGRLNRRLARPVLGTISCSMSRAIFDCVPGATRITCCKVLDNFGGCLGRDGVRRVTGLSRVPSGRRLCSVLNSFIHSRGVT